MKIKSIIACGMLLLTVGAATTSCEDMFTAENKLVSEELAPKDTLYQVMGIVKRMQKLADKSVLLGEIRADLVTVNSDVASTDIQDLHDNNVRFDNLYNKPSDYYDVINNCNIYLAHVDSLLMSHGDYYYEKEICAVKCFRAWCYLELVKIYGEVPYITKPLTTADAAESIVASGQKQDMLYILNQCINDLKDYALKDENNALRPSYGASWSGISYANFFIPVRAMLAELYLWKGTCTGEQADYKDAVRMYHDFFNFPGEERGIVPSANITGVASWANRSHMGNPTTNNTYPINRFSLGGNQTMEQVGVIPCDTSSYYGNTSELRTVFCSLYANNYYPWVIPSQRIRAISTSQVYWYYQYVQNPAYSMDFSTNPNDYDSPDYVGDLRLPSVYYTMSNASRSRYDANLNSEMSFIRKWTAGNLMLSSDQKNPFVPYFRVSILYLHMAEALNRAGFPETAFAVLKHGLTYDVMNDRSIISQQEFDALCEIKSYGFANIESKYENNSELSSKANSSFVIWNSNKFESPAIEEIGQSWLHLPADAPRNAIMQIGIHSLGSGTSSLNTFYYLDDEETQSHKREYYELPDTVALPRRNPTEEQIAAWKESIEALNAVIEQNKEIDAEYAEYLNTPEVKQKRQARVARLILDEEALEGAFEGHRFYDLMRYQKQEGQFQTTITLPSYIGEEYKTSEDNMTGKPWFLTLPSR